MSMRNQPKFYDADGALVDPSGVYAAIQGFCAPDPDHEDDPNYKILIRAGAKRFGSDVEVRAASGNWLPITASVDHVAAVFARLTAPPATAPGDDGPTWISNVGDAPTRTIGTRVFE
jgi:hypothetical protein